MPRRHAAVACSCGSGGRGRESQAKTEPCCFLNLLEFDVPNDVSELTRVSEVVGEFALKHGLTPRVRMALELSLHEHLSNVMHHGFQVHDATPHQIRVRVCLDERELKVEVCDDGRAFNPLEQPPVDTTIPLDEKAVGGLGVHMMRRLTDQMNYRRESGRNILTMVFRPTSNS